MLKLPVEIVPLILHGFFEDKKKTKGGLFNRDFLLKSIGFSHWLVREMLYRENIT